MVLLLLVSEVILTSQLTVAPYILPVKNSLSITASKNATNNLFIPSSFAKRDLLPIPCIV